MTVVFAIYFATVLEKEKFTTTETQQEEISEPALPSAETTPVVENYVENVENGSHEGSSSTVEASNFAEEVLPYTEEQLEILAIIIYQEAGGDKCSDDTRRKVGSVFLNRVNSPLFPDTFYEVATSKKQYGSLYWTGIKWPDRAQYAVEAHAVERAYRIAEELLVEGSILPENVIWQAEFIQGDGIYCHQDGIYFCYSEVSG